jgi:hypothetical protein
MPKSEIHNPKLNWVLKRSAKVIQKFQIQHQKGYTYFVKELLTGLNL